MNKIFQQVLQFNKSDFDFWLNPNKDIQRHEKRNEKWRHQNSRLPIVPVSFGMLSLKHRLFSQKSGASNFLTMSPFLSEW